MHIFILLRPAWNGRNYDTMTQTGDQDMNMNAVTCVTVPDLVLSCDLVLTFVTWCCRVTCSCRGIDYEIYEV